jgi:restriction endonuclease S subunit
MRRGWTETTLGNVVELGKGGAWGADENEANREKAFCLRGTDLADLIDRKHPEAPVRWLTHAELKKAICAPDMVLIETSGSKCGRSVVLTAEMLSRFALPVVYSNFCRTLKIDTRLLSSRFVEMWFSHKYNAGVIPSYRATSAMPNLDVKSLLRMEKVLIPPLVEQQRIVDLVSSVDTYIDALQQQADVAREARNAVLHELLSAGGEGWTETTLGPLITLRTGKLDVNAGVDDGEFPFFTCSRDAYKIDVAAYGGKSVIVAGNGDLNVKYYEGEFNAYQRTYILQTVDETVLNPKFLFCFMEKYVETLRNDTQGSTIQYLKKGQFIDAPIGLPSLVEQSKIVDVVSSMDEVIRSTEQAVADAKNLRSSLLSDLLSGTHEIPHTYDQFFVAA